MFSKTTFSSTKSIFIKIKKSSPKKYLPKPQKRVLNIRRSIILDDHINYHTITCTVFNKNFLVVCATSKCVRYIKGDM